MADQVVISVDEHIKLFKEKMRDSMDHAEGVRDSWHDAAMHLAAIKDQGAHKAAKMAWPDFCEQKLGVTVRWAQQLVKGYKLLVELTAPHEPPPPVAEKAMRLLAQVEPKKRKKVLKEAQRAADAAQSETVTAKHVTMALRKEPPNLPEGDTRDSLQIGLDSEHMITDLQKRLVAIRKDVEALLDDPVGGFVDKVKINAELRSAWETLKFGRPHAVCPYCGGDRCQSCKQLGWVTKPIWSASPTEDREAVRVRGK
jgi:histone H3/H4